MISFLVNGYHMLMDGFPGVIVSDDDFGINSAGLMVTETTITGFTFFDPGRQARVCTGTPGAAVLQLHRQYVQIMLDGNNGGYANDWLLADNNTGEIARFEIGLKMHRVWRTKNGYFVGANFPSDPAFIKTETDFDPTNMSSSPNARHKRWDELMPANKGQIDVELGEEIPCRSL